MTNPKINDMQDQRIVQTGEKPSKLQASRAWNKLRLEVKSSVAMKILDNFFN